jgi:hypothetical protein
MSNMHDLLGLKSHHGGLRYDTESNAVVGRPDSIIIIHDLVQVVVYLR